jgi:hypothetical protein
MKKLVQKIEKKNRYKNKKQSKWIPSDSNGLEIINERVALKLSTR